MLGVQQQSATQPSDLLILYANRQAADRVVALAFELARANAELLSSQAEMEQEDAPETATSPQALLRDQRELDARRTAIQTEIAATQRQLAAAEAAERGALQAKVAELQSELDLVNARRNLLNNMVELAHETDANGSGVSALKEHINAIAASIPAAASDAMPELGAAERPGGRGGDRQRARRCPPSKSVRAGTAFGISAPTCCGSRTSSPRSTRSTPHGGAAADVHRDSRRPRAADRRCCPLAAMRSARRPAGATRPSSRPPVTNTTRSRGSLRKRHRSSCP